MISKYDTDYLVSVCMITYNHEHFIKESIESILNQKTSFNYELIIGEDASTDNTRIICEEYAKSNNNITLLISDKNKGYRKNFFDVLNYAQGKYIAICEGDDYWTDTSKLQMQLNCMESNPNAVICFHDTDIIHLDGYIEKSTYAFSENVTVIKDLINDWYIKTSSLFFRNNKNCYPTWFTQVFNTDYALQLILMRDGGFIMHLPFSMSVYRKHQQGISNTVWGDKTHWWLAHMFILFNQFTSQKYHTLINDRLSKIYDSLSNHYFLNVIDSSLPFKVRISYGLRFLLMKLRLEKIVYNRFKRSNG